MNLLKYLNDQRYFLLLYLVIMSFVSLIMYTSTSSNTVDSIVYTNMSCFLLLTIYLTIQYFIHRHFYNQFREWLESNQGDSLSIPKPFNDEQALFLQLYENQSQKNFSQLQSLYDEKRDYQDFIMSWIHEVKLPIAASRLLMEHSTGKSVEDLIDKLENELDKIDNYIEQALYYSRIDSFSKDYFILDVQLEPIIKESIKKYARLFINKQIHFEIYEGQHFVHSDSKWLAFIIDQVVTNALKYTNEGGEISIRFEEDKKEKRLIIQDNGIGIHPEDIHRVFEKGFTGINGRKHSKSTGMGLYLAKQMALKLSHDLSIQSEVEHTTAVTIHFPKIRNYYHLDRK